MTPNQHNVEAPALERQARKMAASQSLSASLPIVRTSVDHGTALDLASDATLAASADAGSLVTAVELAIEIAQRHSD